MDTKEKGLFQDATGNFFFLLIQKVSKRKPILDIHVLQLFYLAVTLKANHLQGEKKCNEKADFTSNKCTKLSQISEHQGTPREGKQIKASDMPRNRDTQSVLEICHTSVMKSEIHQCWSRLFVIASISLGSRYGLPSKLSSYACQTVRFHAGQTSVRKPSEQSKALELKAH